MAALSAGFGPAALRESEGRPSAEGATAPGISQAKGPQRRIATGQPDRQYGSLESAAGTPAATEGVSAAGFSPHESSQVS